MNVKYPIYSVRGVIKKNAFIYLSITILYPSKYLSSAIINLLQRFIQSSKNFWNALLCPQSKQNAFF